MAENSTPRNTRVFIIDESVLARFWPKVDKAGDCWVWTAADDNFGYGHFSMPDTSGASSLQLAHRVSWIIANGPIPDGMCVLHTCDNPPCVNPAHLFLGTQSDNAHDRDSKGRTVAAHHFGEANGCAKLTKGDVIEIRHAYIEGETQRSIADRYGLTQSGIQSVVTGRVWGHVAEGITRGPESRKRRARGEGNGVAKLTEREVIEIRRAGARGESQREIAARFGVSKPAIGHILRRESWTHIPEEAG
jgi:DNA-binding CsgD family transcriptional regulator